jgi:hypothetical protein
MKSLRFILAVSVSLAALSALRASDNFGRQWMEHYYEQPRPDEFVRAVYSLSRAGYFDEGVQPDTAIGFFAVVFKQNPQRVERWLRTSAPLLNDRPQRILAMAAWLAGSPEGALRAQALSANDDRRDREEVAQMVAAGPSSAVRDLPVNSEPAMNLQWGAFLASGNERYITNVLAALGSNQPGLASSARFALARNAVAHPWVLEICREQLDRQPAPIRSALQAALNDAAAVKAPKPGV